jgi:hypothetical protein
MPVSKKELDELMGLPGVPLTFPTLTVQSNMKTDSNVKVSTSVVDQLWESYKAGALAHKYGVFNSTNPESVSAILDSVTTDTGLDQNTVAAFLLGTEKAVKVQNWGSRWLDPAGAATAETGTYSLNPIQDIKTAAGDLGTTLKNFIAPVADPVTNLVKWTAILVVGGAVVYGIYHGTKIFKARKRKKG